jgi:transposase
VLGPDDCAWRKGDHDGTILVDLPAHRPIDLLPDREAETVERWRRAHPGVEVVSRDRASSSAQGATKGAPDALQIADRSHLVANLRDTVQRLLDRTRQYVPPLQEGTSTALPAKTDEKPLMEPHVQQKERDGGGGERLLLTRAEALHHTRRGKRYERSHAVMERSRQGLGQRAIARTPGLSRNTVHRSLDVGSFPESGPRKTRRSP